MAYPDDLLVDGELVALHTRPHWRTQLRPALTFPLVAAVAGFLAATLRLQTWAPVAWAVIGGVATLVVLRSTVLPLARWRATHVVVTNQRLLVREGLVARRGLDVPIGRIGSVRVHRRPVERLLGCGTLVVEVDDRPPIRFRDVPRVERAQARLHREISRESMRVRNDPGNAPGNDTGTADAVPERSAS